MNTEALPCPYFDVDDGDEMLGGDDGLLVHTKDMENVTGAVHSDRVDDGEYLQRQLIGKLQFDIECSMGDRFQDTCSAEQVASFAAELIYAKQYDVR